MLQTIRDHAQGVIVWTIVGLIIITFALFGLSSYLSGSSKNYVASINGVEISEGEFRQEMQRYQNRLQQMLGNNYNPEMFDPNMVKQEVVNGLVGRELMTQYIDNYGYRVAPAKLVNEIKSFDAFKDESGQFSKARYFELINRQGMSESLFEKQLERDVAARYLQQGVSQSDFTTASEGQKYAELINQQRDIGYLVLSRAPYLKSGKASASQVEDYYNAHKKEFMNPEMVSLEYVELDLSKLAGNYAVSDDAVKKFYEEHRTNYVSKPEQRKVRHILIKVDDKTDEKAALAKLKKIQKSLKKGKKFAELAKESSQDPGSAKQGGDLGFFGKGVMDKAFEASAFSLKKGEVSKPVRSAFGYHLIKLEEIRAEQVKTFENVKKDIRKDLQIQQAEQTFYELSEKLNNISYEQPGSLQPVVDELGLAIQKTGLFHRAGGKGIAALPKVLDAAFSDEVLNLGRNSDLIELSDSRLVVVRKLEHQQASQKSLKDVRKQIIEKLRQQVAKEKMTEQLELAKSRLMKGESPSKVSKGIKGAKWVKAGFVNRDGSSGKSKKAKKVDPQILHKAFALSRPEPKKASWGSAQLANGDAFVVGLYGTKSVAKKSASTAEQQKLAKSNGTEVLRALLEQQRRNASVEINLPKEESL